MAGPILFTTISALTAASGIDGANDYLAIDRLSPLATQKISRNTFLGVTGQPADISSVQTITNKVIGTTNTITGNVASFSLSGTNSRFITYALGTANGTTRIWTFPDGDATFVGVATTQTLTNKTLTSPAITGGTIANSTITVNSIAEFTAANGVTVSGLNIKNGALNTNNSVVTNNLTNASVTANKLATGAAASQVNTSETTASTSYVGLATAQAVTVTVGANGLALVAISATMSNSGADGSSFMAFALSGANTVVSADSTCVSVRETTATASVRVGATMLLTGLAAGSTTFTAQFRVAAGTGTFLNRNISVVPL